LLYHRRRLEFTLVGLCFLGVNTFDVVFVDIIPAVPSVTLPIRGEGAKIFASVFEPLKQ
jgi:hypothetical protein